MSFSTTFFTSPVAAFLESNECIIASAFLRAAWSTTGPAAALIFCYSGSTTYMVNFILSPVCLRVKMISFEALLSTGMVFLRSPVAFLASRECMITSSFLSCTKSTTGPSAAFLFASSGSSATSLSFNF